TFVCGGRYSDMKSSFEDFKKRIRDLGNHSEQKPPRVWEERGQRFRAGRRCPEHQDFSAYLDGNMRFDRRLGILWDVRACVLCRSERLVHNGVTNELAVESGFRFLQSSTWPFHKVWVPALTASLAATVVLLVLFDVQKRNIKFDVPVSFSAEETAKVI